METRQVSLVRCGWWAKTVYWRIEACPGAIPRDLQRFPKPLILEQHLPAKIHLLGSCPNSPAYRWLAHPFLHHSLNPRLIQQCQNSSVCSHQSFQYVKIQIDHTCGRMQGSFLGKECLPAAIFCLIGNWSIGRNNGEDPESYCWWTSQAENWEKREFQISQPPEPVHQTKNNLSSQEHEDGLKDSHRFTWNSSHSPAWGDESDQN